MKAERGRSGVCVSEIGAKQSSHRSQSERANKLRGGDPDKGGAEKNTGR